MNLLALFSLGNKLLLLLLLLLGGSFLFDRLYNDDDDDDTEAKVRQERLSFFVYTMEALSFKEEAIF